MRILVFVWLVSVGSGAAAAPSLLAVSPTSPWTLRELEAVRAPLVSYDPDTGVAYVVASRAEEMRLRGFGFAIGTVEPDVEAPLRQLQATTDLGLYHTHAETVAELESLHARFPALTRLEDIGPSLEGRSILALKISDDPDVEDAGEPDVLVVGCHHAREFMSVEVPLHLARTLLESYGSSPRATRLVDTRELWIVPMLNPDGHVYQENFAAGPDWVPPGWRKNRRVNFDSTVGVDPNRNYSYLWGYDDVGSSPEGADETYRGTGPFSEPETSAMRGLVERQRFTLALSYHSFGKLLLYPWGYTRAFSEDQVVFAVLADSMVRSNGYRPGNPALGTIYLTNGDFDDYMYGEMSPRKPSRTMSFTVELNLQSEGGFWPRDSLIEPTCASLLETNLFALEVADNVRSPLPPPAPVLTAAQDARDGRIIDLAWTQPQDPDNPVDHYEVFEIDPGGLGATPPAVDLRAAGRAQLAGRLARPSGQAIVLEIDAEMEPLWDYAYVEARGSEGVWRVLPGAWTRDDSPTGRNRGRGITGSFRSRACRFELAAVPGPTLDIAIRFEPHPDTPRRSEMIARLDVAATYSESRRVLAPELRQTSYRVVAERSGIFAYGVTAVDADGQKTDSDLYFFVVPTVEVAVSDVTLHRHGLDAELRWVSASDAPARFEVWVRRAGAPAGYDTVTEWRRGDYVRVATIDVERRGESRLGWRGEPGRYNVLLRGVDEDGESFWGPWNLELVGITRLLAPFPNPANPATRLRFDLERDTRVRLDVVGADGRRVRQLAAGFYLAGAHELVWDGRDDRGHQAVTGVYFLRLQAGARAYTQRVVLVR